MDKNTFEVEIIDLVKKQQLLSDDVPVNPLSDDQMNELQKNVYANIDNRFRVAPGEVSEQIPERRERKIAAIKRYVKNLLTTDLFTRSAVAIATVSVVTVGALTYQQLNKQDSPFLVLPESITAEIPYRNVEQGTSRAIVDTDSSVTRNAFVSGVERAELDLVGVTNNDPNNDVDLESNAWVINGYSVEIVRLAALRTLDDLDTSIIGSALEFYREQTPQLSDNDLSNDVPALFVQHHRYLLSVDDTGFAPGDIQNIIDITNQMKVVLR